MVYDLDKCLSACAEGNLDLLKTLLNSENPDDPANHENIQTVVFDAILKKQFMIVNYLLETFKIDLPKTALLLAASTGEIECVEFILDKFKNIPQCTLHICFNEAVRMQQLSRNEQTRKIFAKIVILLGEPLVKCFYDNCQNNDLFIAVSKGEIENVEIILKKPESIPGNILQKCFDEAVNRKNSSHDYQTSQTFAKIVILLGKPLLKSMNYDLDEKISTIQEQSPDLPEQSSDIDNLLEKYHLSDVD